MVSSGIKAESAYYESLHELPLIANLITRKKLYEMNVVISDTAEYGCYLFNHAAYPLLQGFMKTVGADVIGKGMDVKDNSVSNKELIEVNRIIRSTGVETVGATLRGYMSAMKAII
jgi:ketol-acid reductoisomerase